MGRHKREDREGETLIINFVGLFNAPGYVGEISDETHLAREMEAQGHVVRRIPRDAWREYVLEDFPENKYDVPLELEADINIIAKWHHFYDRRFVDELRRFSKAPVFYWVWDFMHDGGFPDWHINMARAADLYISGEAGISSWYRAEGVRHYYFQFDCADGGLPTFSIHNHLHDVVLLGSCLPQGHRKEWVQAINKEVPVRIYSWNCQEWRDLGIDASPAVYGAEANEIIARSKINLGFSVEPHCWGYWSNRTGKTLLAEGFLLYEYAPGMESFLRDGAAYFSSPEEAVEKIKYYLENDEEREKIRRRGAEIGRDKFSSRARVAELCILMERYLKGKPTEWLL